MTIFFTNGKTLSQTTKKSKMLSSLTPAFNLLLVIRPSHNGKEFTTDN